MLAVMIQRWTKDSDAIFIDRDPGCFKYILDFYRDDQVLLPFTTSPERFRKEAERLALDLEDPSVKVDIAQLSRLRLAISDFDRDGPEPEPEPISGSDSIISESKTRYFWMDWI